ncbi:hypothetical protein MSPP1_001030 [Malassezia sp. CBS 17886]|nr:hypothetical protein MSPP1_001030 [Malassezia sp. CBS 17886]
MDPEPSAHGAGAAQGAAGSQSHGAPAGGDDAYAARAWIIDDGESDDDDDDSDVDDWDVYRDFFNLGPPSLQERSDAGALRALPAAGEPLVSFAAGSGAHTPFAEREDADGMRGSASLGQLFSGGYTSVGDDSKQYMDDSLAGPRDSVLEMAEMAPLGPEFSEDERARMTRAARRKQWGQRRVDTFAEWAQGRRLLGGWFGPRMALVIGFAFVVVLAALLYFVVPRVPTVTLLAARPLQPAGKPDDMQITTSPAGFAMNGTLGLRLNNHDAWIPSHVLRLDTTVSYEAGKSKVGTGHITGRWVPGRQSTMLKIPVAFSHTSVNSTGDSTQLAFQKACAHPYQGVVRTQLSLHVKVVMEIGGVIGSKMSAFDMNDVDCPWTLPN